MKNPTVVIFTTVFAGEAVEIQKKPKGIKILYFFDFDLFDLGIAGAMGKEMADEEKNIKKAVVTLKKGDSIKLYEGI